MNDTASLIDIVLMFKDKEWFNELYKKGEEVKYKILDFDAKLFIYGIWWGYNKGYENGINYACNIIQNYKNQ